MAYEKPSNKMMLLFAGLLYVMLVLVSGPAIGQKIDGIGAQRPAHGSPVFWVPGTCPPEYISSTLDTSAHPWCLSGRGECQQEVDTPALYQRYGMCRAFGGRFVGADAESIYQVASIALTEACLCNEFGTAATHTCYPTYEELHDFWAVQNRHYSQHGLVRQYGFSGACQNGVPPPLPPPGRTCPNGQLDPGEFCSCEEGRPNCVPCPEDIEANGYDCGPVEPPPPVDTAAWGDGICAPSETAACKADCQYPPLPPVCPLGTACREEPPTCRPPCDISACIAIAKRMDTWTGGSLGNARIRIIDQQLACLLAADKACAVRP